jgi:zinc protease
MRIPIPRVTALVAVLVLFWNGVRAFPCPGAPPRSSSNQQSDPFVQAAAALYDGIRTETLPNGLHVYLKPVPDSPVVTTMVAYKVGSADEDLDHTGLSHYLEHLMFKGTDRIMPGDIDRLTLRNGGENNAYTSEDYTIFHFDFAADRWQAALAVEADRMRNLRIDAKHEFEQEKGAVIEELRRNEDSPWDLEQKAMLPLLYSKAAPYGHPVIGEREHVRSATASVIKAHYDRWYHPNNASLIVCGGFDPDQALSRIRELFGPIPKKELPARKESLPARRGQPVHKVIESKFVSPRLLVAFNTIRTGDPGYHALELIQAVLAGGKTGRLYKGLVEGQELATSVNGSNSTGRYPGSFEIEVELLRGKDPQAAEKRVIEEIERLRNEPIGEAELRRAKQGILASEIFARESVHGLGDRIARGVTTNDLGYLKNYLPLISAVTPADIQQAARLYLDPGRRVVIASVAAKEGHAPGGAAAPASPGHRRAPLRGRFGSACARDGQVQGGPIERFNLRRTKRVVLDNGLTLLLLENRRLPVVVAEAFVRNGRLLEPAAQAGVAHLTGALLDEGTDKHTGPEIAELIEDVGGSLDLTSTGGAVQVLSADRSLGLKLLFECLARPAFPEDAVARQKLRLLTEIDDQERQPEVKAQMAYDALVYGQHPFARPDLGTHQSVEKLTRADLVAFHRRLFAPNNTILAVVGDFDSSKVVDEIQALCREFEWKRKELPPPVVPPAAMPHTFTQKILAMPRAEQLHFYMGHLGIRRSDPNYYKLLVMDYVLGTGPGFTDRLSARMRDREGLAYTVSANITSSATEEPGLFTCYIGTEPRNFARVKQTFLDELNRLRQAEPTASEVEDAKKYLLGNLPFQLTTNARIARQLLSIERYSLGFDYFERYQKAVAAVTPADIKRVAEQYLDPKRMVVVAAGPLGPDGTNLGSAPAAHGRE